MRKFFSGIVVVLLLLMGTVWSAGKEPEAVQTIGNKAARLVAGEGMLRLMEQELMEQSQAHPEVALTFDDGPSPKYTPLLLDGLKERNVRATFFLLGAECEKYPEIVKKIHADGHLIGVHSYEHVNLSNLTDQAAMEQVDKTDQIIFGLTGEHAQYIRPPYGCWKCNLDYETKMIEVLWDVDPLDWKTDNSSVIAKRVMDKVQENDIILLHDASESSVNAAFLIIDELQGEGYSFVTVEELILE